MVSLLYFPMPNGYLSRSELQLLIRSLEHQITNSYNQYRYGFWLGKEYKSIVNLSGKKIEFSHELRTVGYLIKSSHNDSSFEQN